MTLPNDCDNLEAELDVSSGSACIAATFQAVLTLCLSFLIIAALRTPFLTEEALDRAKLLERVQGLAQMLREANSEVDGFITVIEAEGLTRAEALEWMDDVASRIRKAEMDAVETHVCADSLDKWFPDVVRLTGLTKCDPATSILNERGELLLPDGYRVPEEAEQWCTKHREALIAAITRKVTQTVLAREEQLFRSTQEAIRKKGRKLLNDHLACLYAEYVRKVAAGTALDWNDFRRHYGDVSQAASRASYLNTYYAFQKQVCERVPCPGVIGDRQYAARSDLLAARKQALAALQAAIGDNFERRCRQLNEEDGKLAQAVDGLLDSRPMKPEQLYESDGGRKAMEKHVRRLAKVPAGRPLGPCTREALNRVAGELFESETQRVRGVIIARLQAADWDAVNKRGLKIAYEDYHDTDERIRQLAGKLPQCIGLPAGKPADQSFQIQLALTAKKRAKELFQGRLRTIQKTIASAAAPLFPEYEAEIGAGKTELAKQAAESPEAARGMILADVCRRLGISRPTPQHENLWNRDALDAIENGTERRIEDYNKRFASNRSGPKIIDEITILERSRKERWLPRITTALVAISPQELHGNKKFQASQRARAAKLFDARVQRLEREFLQAAEARIMVLAAAHGPEAWKARSIESLNDKLYAHLMEEMAKHVTAVAP